MTMQQKKDSDSGFQPEDDLKGVFLKWFDAKQATIKLQALQEQAKGIANKPKNPAVFREELGLTHVEDGIIAEFLKVTDDGKPRRKPKPPRPFPEFWDNRNPNYNAYACGCHNCACLIVFLAYWFVMFLIMWQSAVNRGSPVLSLVYGTDYAGYTCGTNNPCRTAVQNGKTVNLKERDLTTRPYLMYPLHAQSLDNFRVDSLYGICTDKCPGSRSSFQYPCDCLGSNPLMSSKQECSKMSKDFRSNTASQHARHGCFCEHDKQRCWDTSYPTTNVMFRCLPFEASSVKLSTQCTNRTGGILYELIGDKNCRRNETKYLESKTVQQERPEVADMFGAS